MAVGFYLLFVSDVFPPPPFPSLAFFGRQNFVGAAVRQDLVENRYLQTSKLKARFPSPLLLILLLSCAFHRCDELL